MEEGHDENMLRVSETVAPCDESLKKSRIVHLKTKKALTDKGRRVRKGRREFTGYRRRKSGARDRSAGRIPSTLSPPSGVMLGGG